MKDIIIVGSGPVGSFTAVLCAQLGFPVTVYEKRPYFSRNINLNLENDFSKTVHETLCRLNVKTDFFEKLNEYLQSQRNKIKIKDLEERLVKEAKTQGAVYVTREIESFGELYEEHKNADPIILDCTGRNSKLRINEFGPDMHNIVSSPLQHAMYINFKVKIPDMERDYWGDIASLYQVMKYVRNIKLTKVVLNKHKDEYGFSDATLPVFITEELARRFDEEYPDINSRPINPFNSSRPVPECIFYPISSLIGNFIVDGCNVDLNSVKVKKIEISCGYAQRRSRDNYVCLGDSAIHLAFFRSLNLGLKHALEFFVKLSMLQDNEQVITNSEIMKKFTECCPHLQPVCVYPTVARNVFLVVTKVIWYGCHSFCLTNNVVERLTSPLGVSKKELGNILIELNRKLRTWSNSLKDFEAKRDEDIKKEISSNMMTNMFYDSVSLFININGKSFIKMSEFARTAKGKHPLYPKDFKFLFRCFEARREAVASGRISVIRNVLNQSKPTEFLQLKRICSKHLPDVEKLKLIAMVANVHFSKSWDIIKAARDYSGLRISSNFILTLINNEIAQIQGPPELYAELKAMDLVAGRTAHETIAA